MRIEMSDDTYIRTLLAEAHERSKVDPNNQLKTFALQNALDLTNGQRGDLGRMCDHLGTITLLIAEQDDRHLKSCPYLADKNKPKSRLASAFSVKWGKTSVSLAGPAAVAAVLILGLLGFSWIRSSTRAEIKAALAPVVTAIRDDLN